MSCLNPWRSKNDCFPELVQECGKHDGDRRHYRRGRTGRGQLLDRKRCFRKGFRKRWKHQRCGERGPGCQQPS